MVNRRWHLGHREERMQLLLGLAGITHAAFLDTRTVGCGLWAAACGEGAGWGADLALSPPCLGLQQPQGAEGPAQQQAEVQAAHGPRIRRPCPVAVDSGPVASGCSVLVLQVTLPGPQGPPPA